MLERGFRAGVDGLQRLKFAHLGLSKGSHCVTSVLSPGTLLVQALGGLAQPFPTYSTGLTRPQIWDSGLGM